MQRVKDLIKLYKLNVWTLLIFTAIISYLLAVKAGYTFNLFTFLMMIIAGSFTIMGDGALNEYLERDTDRLMDRTKKRPLVKGTISPNFALYSGIILVIAGILLSYLFINALTSFFMFFATAMYMIYTYLKKRTWLNVIIGGFAGNCTAWGGWAAATNNFNVFAFLLGMLIYFWTNPHIWALAMRRREDYLNANIKMLTAMYDEKTSSKYIAYSAIPLPIVSTLIGYIGGFSLVYLLLSLVLNVIFFVIIARILMNPTKKNAWLLFKFSTPYLALIFLFMFIDPASLAIKF
ncbi:MAG TPA: heme o synthase [Geobacterales bacterium]|nr:heme o synthase [Geobacterales bacterium]